MATNTVVNYTFGFANGDSAKVSLPVELTAAQVRTNIAELDTQGVTWNGIYSVNASAIDGYDEDAEEKLEKYQVTGVTAAEIVTTAKTEFSDFPYYPTIE